jgi:hypothetical protein
LTRPPRSNGAITGKVDKDEFKRAFTRIVTDIATDKVNTRTLNKKEDVEKYLVSLGKDLPDKKKKGSFTAADFEDQTSKPSTSTPTAPPKKSAPKQQRQSLSVIPSGVRCSVKSARIKDVFGELRRLPLEKCPNSSAVLFRILLELSIGYYLDKTKKIQPLLAAAQKKGKSSDWYPTLRQMLDAILKDASFTLPTMARKRLNKIVSDATSPLSVDGLDSYVHNRFSPPTPRELRHYWDTFEELFAVVLDEPTAAAKGSASGSN